MLGLHYAAVVVAALYVDILDIFVCFCVLAVTVQHGEQDGAGCNQNDRRDDYDDYQFLAVWLFGGDFFSVGCPGVLCSAGCFGVLDLRHNYLRYFLLLFVLSFCPVDYGSSHIRKISLQYGSVDDLYVAVIVYVGEHELLI